MFGQLVVGPPGSGKTAFCAAMKRFYEQTGRSVAIVNLDPGNCSFIEHETAPHAESNAANIQSGAENIVNTSAEDNAGQTESNTESQEKADIDIADLVSMQQAMQQHLLGPNGAMLYCLQTLDVNFEWLANRIRALGQKYLLFDCPGQVELFTDHPALTSIVKKLERMDIRLCCVNLVDAHYCTDHSKYISVLVQSLRSMLQLQLPQVNILSKIDLLRSYGQLDFNLDYYTQVHDLSYLLSIMETDTYHSSKYLKLSAALCELISDFGLVGFKTLCIDDNESVICIARAIDKANGYVYGGLEKANESLFATAERWNSMDWQDRIMAEKYLHHPEEENEYLVKDIADHYDLSG